MRPDHDDLADILEELLVKFRHVIHLIINIHVSIVL